MKRLTLLGMLLFVAGCGRSAVPPGYLEAVQLLNLESDELHRAVLWNDYVQTTFVPERPYPFVGENIRGVAPNTPEEAANELKKATDYLAKQRTRVERARKLRDAADF